MNRNEGHGIGFHNEVKRIKKLGYEIPISTDSDTLKVDSTTTKEKLVYYIILIKLNGDISIGLVNKFDLELFNTKFGYLKKHGYKMFLGKTSNPDTQKYPKARTVKTLKFYNIEYSEYFKTGIINEL